MEDVYGNFDLSHFFSALSFFFFGGACFVTKEMKSEFKRYGLSSFRKIVGLLQLLGAIGLVLGYIYQPYLQAFAAAGLSFLMVLGFLVRIKIKDTFFQSAPSLFYAILNAFLFYELMLFL
ncbi:DoxX family protein [Maribacter halichondriae]|uniref:DoxX family protein n=1 Tax=Maribacter halichondriae TaxID=2980554 RepID=UPI00235926CF|nr:DoxX family protein [Maribacter sp. Hal144]